MQLERVKCNLCGSEEYTHFLNREDLLLFLPGEFTLVKCDTCGLVYENPRPVLADLPLIYPDTYDPFDDPEKRSKLKKLQVSYGHRKKLRWIEKFQNGGNICDVGCATGDFVYEAQATDKWTAFGVEPSAKAVQTAIERGLNIKKGVFEESIFPNVQFDVVTMWNVIEHLADPKHTLEKINQKLKSGGWLVFTTPRLLTFGSNFFGKYWMGYELPRHFYVFSTETIEQLLQRTGFAVCETACVYGTFALTMTSVRFWLSSLTGKRNPMVEKILFSPIMQLLTLPYFYLQDQLKLSSSITVFAQKTT